MVHSPPFSSDEIGSIRLPQLSARSPGKISTCFEYKHFGQWLVNPFPLTSMLQFSQTKSSIFLLNFEDIKKEAKSFGVPRIGLGPNAPKAFILPLYYTPPSVRSSGPSA